MRDVFVLLFVAHVGFDVERSRLDVALLRQPEDVSLHMRRIELAGLSRDVSTLVTEHVWLAPRAAGDPTIAHLLGRAMERFGDPATAAAYYSLSLSIEPAAIDVRYDRALLTRSFDDLREVALRSRSPDVWLSLTRYCAAFPLICSEREWRQLGHQSTGAAVLR